LLSAVLRHILAVLIILPATAVAAFCEDRDDPLPAPIQDPSLATSVYFAPTRATAGVAYPGLSLSSTRHIGTLSCTGTNPCALATPAIDRAVPAKAE